MKIKIEDSVKSYKVFLVALLISFCTILPILIQSGWNLYMVGDYMTQQIPFIKESRRMFLSGTPFWSWNTFLGANYLGSYSFYVYGSPFFWPLVILPERFLGTGLKSMCVPSFMRRQAHLCMRSHSSPWTQRSIIIFLM